MKKYFKYLGLNTSGLLAMLGMLLLYVSVMVGIIGLIYLGIHITLLRNILGIIMFIVCAVAICVIVLGLLAIIVGGIAELVVLSYKFNKQKRKLKIKKKMENE